MKNSIGFLSTVMLGIVALLGASGVQAAFDLDAAEKNEPVTYAKETLTSSVKGKDGATYYVVDGGVDLLGVHGKVGVGGTAASVLIIQYTLDGMVFTENSAPTLNLGPPPGLNEENLNACGSGNANNVAIKRGGGLKGENYVSFIYTREPDTSTDLSVACLALEDVAVSAGGSGSITIEVTDNLPLPTAHRSSYPNAVRVVNALMPMPMKNNPTARVASGFLSFTNDADTALGSTVSLGSFELGLANPAPLNATPAANDPPEAVTLTGLLELGTDLTQHSTAEIMGNFSFVSSAWLDTASTCLETGDLRMEEDEDMMRDTTRLMMQALGTFITEMHLCIMVLPAGDEDAVTIPETGPYMIGTSYVSLLDDAAFPPSAGTHELGSIMRDGTTVRIPYLTTFPAYNQRIVIRNRGGAAMYQMAFHTEDGATASPGADAEGMLPADSVTYLSMKHGDVVTLTDTFRVAATLTVVSESRLIDVTVSQTNDNGGTDTVVLTDTNR